jgi:hypothetical protein
MQLTLPRQFGAHSRRARVRGLVAVAAAAAAAAGCGASTISTTTTVTGGAAGTPPLAHAPAASATTISRAGGELDEGAGVRPRTLPERVVIAATRYAGRYLAHHHGLLRGVEYLGPDRSHAGWQMVLVTYAARSGGRGDTSADLLLSVAHRRAGWTVVRAR